jgi:hypothetical protein
MGTARLKDARSSALAALLSFGIKKSGAWVSI